MCARQPGHRQGTETHCAQRSYNICTKHTEHTEHCTPCRLHTHCTLIGYCAQLAHKAHWAQKNAAHSKRTAFAQCTPSALSFAQLTTCSCLCIVHMPCNALRTLCTVHTDDVAQMISGTKHSLHQEICARKEHTAHNNLRACAQFGMLCLALMHTL
jgi:hypothetical protein